MMRARPVKSPPADLFGIVPNSVVGVLVASPGAVLATLQSSARQDRPNSRFNEDGFKNTFCLSLRINMDRANSNENHEEGERSVPNSQSSCSVGRRETSWRVAMFADVQHLHHVSQVARCSVLSLSLSASSLSFYLSLSLPLPLLSLSCRDGRWCMTPHIRAARSMGLDRKRAPATLPRESLRRRHAATGRSPVERAGVRREHWQDLLGP